MLLVLSFVGGYFEVNDCDVLISFVGFEMFSVLGEDLDICANVKFVDILVFFMFIGFVVGGGGFFLLILINDSLEMFYGLEGFG